MSLAFLRGEWLRKEINTFQSLAFDDVSGSLYLSQSCILFHLSVFLNWDLFANSAIQVPEAAQGRAVLTPEVN